LTTEDEKDRPCAKIYCPNCGNLFKVDIEITGESGVPYYIFNRILTCECGHDINIMLAVQDKHYGEYKNNLNPKDTILFRPHPNKLIGLMNETLSFKSRAELIDYLDSHLSKHLTQYEKINTDKFYIYPYYGYIAGNEKLKALYPFGLNTYVVSMEGYGILGFTNGPLF